MRMKNEINSLDAPEGYKAIKPIANPCTEDICNGCAFVESTRCDMKRNCCIDDRKDKQSVIFVKADKSITAIAMRFLQFLMITIAFMIVFVISVQVGIYHTNQQWHNGIEQIMNEGLHE